MLSLFRPRIVMPLDSAGNTLAAKDEPRLGLPAQVSVSTKAQMKLSPRNCQLS